MVTVVAVTPGADALLSPPPPPSPLEPPQAAARESAASPARICRRVFEDLRVMNTSFSGDRSLTLHSPVGGT
jgi:hypothetical protein